MQFKRYNTEEHGDPELSFAADMDPEQMATWDEIISSLQGELSLDDPFDVYELNREYHGHPAGSITVIRLDGPRDFTYWIEVPPKAESPLS